MEELEIIKAFAELEGELAVTDRCGNVYIMKQFAECKSHRLPVLFNPITDLALAFKAMIDYKVDKFNSEITEGATRFSMADGTNGIAFSDKAIPLVIISCILKSKGLWK